MNTRPSFALLLFYLAAFCAESVWGAVSLNATYLTGDEVPVSVGSYAATDEVAFALGYAPAVGTELMVVENTGLAAITGEFSNLAQGDEVVMRYGGLNYEFVANYYGGTGNDLVLVWKWTELTAWGRDDHGQLGDWTTVVVVSGGKSHSVALCSDGTVVSWGYNFAGQLGDGTTTNSSVPVRLDQSGVLSGKTVVSVVAGYSNSFALCSDGTIAAWGANGVGQLGDGTMTTTSVPVLVDQTGVLSTKTVTTMSAGNVHILALCSDGTAAVWGSGLGSGPGSSSVPVLVDQSGVLSGKTMISVAAGEEHSVVACSDGTLAAWGKNSDSQLGTGGVVSSATPALVNQSGVLSGKTVLAVAAGANHTLALCSDGTMAAWGRNGTGQLGNGTTTNPFQPVLVDHSGVLSGKTVVSVAAGQSHSLASCSDGTVAAWGWNPFGQLGDGTTTNRSVPVLVDASGALSGKTVVSVEAEYNGGVVRCDDGSVASWGRNSLGQLGDGTTTDSSVPVLVDQRGVLVGKTVVSETAGRFHSVVLCHDGTVASWGRNNYGQLGDGTTTSRVGPVLVDQTGVLAGKTVVSVATGPTHGVALCRDGTLATWGQNYTGMLGDGTTTQRNAPVLVDQTGVLLGKTVVAVAAGTFHNVVLCSDGTLATWGNNDFSQLGDGTSTDRHVPVLVDQTGVLTGKTVVEVAAGFGHTVVRCSDDTLAAWGYNAGQLGDGTTTWRNVPVLVDQTGVLNGKTPVSLAAGTEHTMVLCSDGTVVTWGQDEYGQLGEGPTELDSTVPVLVNQSGVLAGKTVISVSAGDYHNVVKCSDGTVASWGRNEYLQLGQVGAVVERQEPVLVIHNAFTSEKSKVSITSGPSHNIAILGVADPVIEEPVVLVDTAVDENDGVTVGGVSLREAIDSAAPNATITFASSLSGQTSVLAHGQLVIDKDLTIDGSALEDGITLDANGGTTNHRVLEIDTNAIVQLDSLTLTGGNTPDGGGAGSDGGGIFITNGSRLTLNRCTISGNTTGSGGHGGGIHNASSQDLTINSCTVSGNATGNGGAGPSGSGGGISHMGANLFLNFCTISNNATGDGGSAAGSGGGIHDDGGLVMFNSVIADNRTGINGFSAYGEGPDLWKDFGGLFFSGSGINFIGDLSDSGLSASSTLLTGDALLAPLGDYGGATRTMMPLPGSPLIDPPGTDEFSLLFSQDQRGTLRNFNRAVDIGAVEYVYEYALIWTSDFDGDGRAYGMEYALGTDPNVSDAAHPANLTAPTVTAGQVSLTFGYNCMAAPRTNWVLTRSTDLSPGSFVEIYRFDGPNNMEILQPDIGSSVTANSITVMDNDPPAGRAFYRLEAQRMPLLLSQVDSISFSNGIVDEVWIIVPEVWTDSDDYSFQIEISGINAGYHFHGEDTIQMSETALLVVSAGDALLSFPWTEDLLVTHSPETYTVCLRVFYKGEFMGYRNCTAFGPF